jgi:hypothetical protein
MRGGDAHGSINGADERTGVDCRERYFGECLAQTFRLATACLVERDVCAAKREATVVVLRFTMPNEEDARRHTQVSPDRR